MFLIKKAILLGNPDITSGNNLTVRRCPQKDHSVSREYHEMKFLSNLKITTVINLEHSNQWFCTEEEAIEAGFERARE